MPSLSVDVHTKDLFLSLDCCFGVHFFLSIVFRGRQWSFLSAPLSKVRLVSANSFDLALFQDRSFAHSLILCFKQSCCAGFTSLSYHKELVAPVKDKGLFVSLLARLLGSVDTSFLGARIHCVFRAAGFFGCRCLWLFDVNQRLEDTAAWHTVYPGPVTRANT